MSDRDKARSLHGVAPSSGAVAQGGRLRWLFSSLASALVVVLVVAGLVYVISRHTDSDGDGLTDHVEKSGWRTVSGFAYTTDPDAADTDGDGLGDADEAGMVVSGSGDSTLYAGVSDPTKTDSDDDGLVDAVEIGEWLSTDGEAFRTEPMEPDTDGDGLIDGDEAGEEVSLADDRVVYALFSNPLTADTDGDDLSDAQEADLSLNAFERDSDGDSLEDGREVEHFGTAPDAADTDGDGFNDGFEIENQAARGLDPLWPDVKVDSSTYKTEFLQGLVVGEFAPGDSLAWMAGNLVSTGSSAVPGVGWIVGGAADLRDAVALAIRSDWVGASFSLVGAVPVTGDAASVPVKITKFVERHPALAPVVGSMIARLDWVPHNLKVAALRSPSPAHWDFLRNAGVSEKSLVRLQQGKTGVSFLAEAMEHLGHAQGERAHFFATSEDAEEFLAGLAREPATQVSFSTKDCDAVCNTLIREVDVFTNNVAHESKIGRVYLTPSIEKQIMSDHFLVEQGEIERAHWHFFPSSVSNTVGPSQQVIDVLNKLDIDYTIHLPA